MCERERRKSCTAEIEIESREEGGTEGGYPGQSSTATRVVPFCTRLKSWGRDSSTEDFSLSSLPLSLGP